MREISIQDLFKIDKKDIQIIDVRENYEYENGHLDAINIPMEDILNSIDKIQLNKKIIIYCQSGRRAAAVVYMLYKIHGIENVWSLSGGYKSYLEVQSTEKNFK